jgi:hypothetical protein
MSVLEDREKRMLEPLCQAFLHLWDAYMLGTLKEEHRESVCNAWAMVQARQALLEVSHGEMD